MTSQFLIYALVDPRTGKRFYVGQSSVGMLRPRSHMKPANLKDPCPKAAYLRGLVAVGLAPEIEVLQYIADPDESIPPPIRCWSGEDIGALNAAEMWWIAHGNDAGWPLTNRTDGGEGARGMIITPEHRANMSKAALGKKKAPFTDEQRANMSRAAKGKPKSAAHIAKMAATKTGQTQRPETIAKRAAALTGQKRTPEARLRISEAVKNSPKAIAQRTVVWAAQTGAKRQLPVWTAEQRENHRVAQGMRRGSKLTAEHRQKLSLAKKRSAVIRDFALLLAGLATIR